MEFDGCTITRTPCNRKHVGFWVVMASYSFSVAGGWYGTHDLPTFNVEGSFADAVAKACELVTIRPGDRITRGSGKDRKQRRVSDVIVTVVDASNVTRH